jgi:hypothetical protein
MLQWVQAMEEEGQSLELLEKKLIEKGLRFNHIGCNGYAIQK